MKFNQLKLSFLLLLLVFIISMISSCKEDDPAVIPPEPTLPVLTTVAVTNISATAARSGGKISNDGGSKVTARGVCFGLNADPVITGGKTINGSDTGSFISIISGLKANTLYYVRAYATNSKGTAYGNTFIFNTTVYFLPGNGVTDIDGNYYTSVILSSQEWMGENLKVSRYQNGDSITKITDNNVWTSLTEGAYCDYGNDPANSITYGKLYNFYAVDDIRYLCPAGWHVPTHDEWTTLINYLGGETNAGGRMKEAGTIHWMSPNTAATNESGFNALPAGLRGSFVGTYNYLNEETDWWSSTEDDETNAWETYLIFNNSSATTHYYDKNLGLSVRCIKNK
jgi:uncharacterized protein (TIGR02145 family)